MSKLRHKINTVVNEFLHDIEPVYDELKAKGQEDLAKKLVDISGHLDGWHHDAAAALLDLERSEQEEMAREAKSNVTDKDTFTCEKCDGTLKFVASVAAPGVGNAWGCTSCGGLRSQRAHHEPGGCDLI
jgi:hypothetical protein